MPFLITFQASFHPKTKMSLGCGFMKVIFMLKLIQKKSNAQKMK
jgi:hypothetical protein